MKNISICIPTYNRAKSVDICLSYLSKFANLDFEVIVGNNCSTDNTEAVVNKYTDIFPYFNAIHRRENIGFTRNMDSILRMASRKYIYILCDDDLVFEEALMLMSSIMEANPGVSAMTGQYVSVRKQDLEMRIDYSDAAAIIVNQNDHAGLFAHMGYCDAHPFMRRDVFTRFAAYQDRTGALIPLYMRMLSQGGLIVINKPIFQHMTTTDSLSTGMTEPWFIDMGMADLELAKANLGNVEGWSIWDAKKRLSQLFYFQASRMAWNKGDYALLWLFLNRCKAVDAINDELLVKCEYSFMHEFVLGRLVRVIEDFVSDDIYYVPSHLLNGILGELQEKCKSVTFIETTSDTHIKPRALVLGDSNQREILSVYPKATCLFVQDIFEYFRVTTYAANLVLVDKRLIVNFTTEAAIELLTANTGNFQRLCAVYSSEE